MIPCKRFCISLFTLLLCVTGTTAFVSAQALRLPRPSQKASVMQTIGVTDVTIIYSRPGVKGRPIWVTRPPRWRREPKAKALWIIRTSG
jgi:hypothetical protein